MQTRLSLRLSDTERMELGKAIKAARLSKGLTQAELGDKFSVTKAAVALWESGKNMPDPRKLAELVRILDLDPYVAIGSQNGSNVHFGTLPDKDHSVTLGGSSRPAGASGDVKEAGQAPIPLDRSELPRIVPVLGVVVGGDAGEFSMNNGDPVDYARETPRIRGRRDVFALYVQNDSMSPWRERGQLVYVESVKPAQINDYVVIEMKAERGSDERPAFLKKLVGRDATRLKVRQFHPPKDFPIDRAKVHRVYRVIDWSELLGS